MATVRNAPFCASSGTDRVQRKSRYVTKTTFLLIDHLQSVGDFGQHRDDFPETPVTVGFAATVVLTAIALVESLTTDLQREPGPDSAAS